MKSVRFHRLAAAEFRSARAWYAARSREAALSFVKAVDEAVERLGAAPETCPAEVEQCRRMRVARFPYRLVFDIQSDGQIMILAVVHSRRRPGYWRRRRHDAIE